MKEQIDIIIDLLVEFDEMGFVPSVLVPNKEAYAIKWRDEITKALVDCLKQKEGEWIEKSEDKDEYYEYCYKCSVCGKWSIMEEEEFSNFCPNCGAHMKGATDERED
jgi:predicted RNA-binding Zn-ribbon protein involved in translation (DUF1610 family)